MRLWLYKYKNKYKKCFNLRARKLHLTKYKKTFLRKYKNFFRVAFFYFLSLGLKVRQVAATITTELILKDLISGIVYKFQCYLCSESHYGKSIRHLDVEHVDQNVSPFLLLKEGQTNQ